MLYGQARRLVALGGGGNKGTPALLLDDLFRRSPPDPKRLVPADGLLRPGIAIENVCPSFRL